MQRPKRIAFLFPGQGHVPNTLPSSSAVGERLLRLAESNGFPLQEWLKTDDPILFTRTEHAQPAILIDSLAKAEVLYSREIVPDIVAGHSLGEYAAFVTAGMITPEDALRVVIERGKLMSHVDGAMAAVVKLPIEETAKICESFAPNVVVANHNGPMQAVISGVESAVRSAMKAAENAGARAIPLAVSGPFHSPLMSEAEGALAPIIEALPFRNPTVPVISSVSGHREKDPATLKGLLLTQMTSSVRWLDVVRSLVKQNITVAVEVGSGNVLTGLGKRTTSKIDFLSFEEAVNG